MPPLYEWSCPKCGKREDGFRTVDERHDSPLCHGARMGIVISLAHVQADLPGYESPTTGKWIEGRAARREDLKRSGARPYEGFEVEKSARPINAWPSARRKTTRKLEQKVRQAYSPTTARQTSGAGDTVNEDEVLATEPLDATPTDITPEPVTPTEAAPASMEDTIRETYQKLTTPKRERGTDGKFLRTESTEVPGSTGTEAAAPTETAPVPTEPKPWERAPNTWKKEVTDLYGTLPEPVRQEIHRREEDFHKGISQYKDAAAFGHSLFEDISPHFDVMRQIGGTPKEVVREAVNTWRTLATGSPDQKRDTLLSIARNYGITLAEHADTRYREPSTSPELAPVLQRIAQLEGTITESQRAREEAEHAERVSHAQKFLSDPSREHMEAVFDDVVALVRAGRTPEQAYEQAIWAHPDTRAKLMAKQESERKQREAAEAAAARKASSANVQRRGTPPAAVKPGTMEDTIRQTLRSMQS